MDRYYVYSTYEVPYQEPPDDSDSDNFDPQPPPAGPKKLSTTESRWNTETSITLISDKDEVRFEVRE